MISDLLLTGRRVIEKEAQALKALGPELGESFVAACETIFNCKGTILLTGMGKSGLVARKWASTFSSTGITAYFINPAEAPHGDLGIMRAGDILIALSFSGETEELGVLLRHAKETNVRMIGVTGNPTNSLARQTEIVLSIRVPEEACSLGLAPTTSTTLMMALGDALAVTLMQMRGFTEHDFARLHPGGSLGKKLWLRVESLMHSAEAIPVVHPTDRIERVLLEMTEKRLGMTVVMEGKVVVGIITDGDLRRHFQKNGIEAARTAAEILTPKPKTIAPRALAVEAREMMETNSIQHLLVEDAEQILVGVLHLQDLLKNKVL